MRTKIKRHGLSVVWLILVMTVLIGLASLAVDFGRVQVVKTELRRAADAAARAAVTDMKISVTTAESSAVSVAASNKADGTSISLDPLSDIEFGIWDPNKRAFNPLPLTSRSSGNAVRVTARRTAQKGNAVPLVFARMLGASMCDVQASATAYAPPEGGYGIVGLNFINISGKKTDKYNSKRGKYDPTTASRGNIGSNGNITLSSYVTVNGDARPGVGKSVVMDGTCTVTGATTPLKAPLTFDMPSAGTYANVNDNAQLTPYLTKQKDFSMTGGSLTLTGGHYYVRDFHLGGGASITLTGPAVLYCAGTLTISGSINTNLGVPGQLTIKMVSGTASNTATFNGTTAFAANFYGPKSPITISGNADYFGQVVALSVTCTGSGGIHYDAAEDPTDGTGIVLVE